MASEDAPDRSELELRKLTAETLIAEHRLALIELELDEAKRRERQYMASAEAAGVYHFFGGVDSESVERAVREIGCWSRAHPGRGLRLMINSPGGSISEGLAFYDFLRDTAETNGHLIETVGIGKVMSMGAALLQAGDRRVLMENATMMLHRPTWTSAGEAHEHEDRQKWVELDEKKLVAILAQRSPLTRKEIRELWNRRQLFLDARESLRLGLCDEVRGAAKPGRRRRSS